MKVKPLDVLWVAVFFLIIIIILDKMQKFKDVTKPLKRRKCDSGGCGHFGARRSAHPDKPHQGQDFLVAPGSPVFAPTGGTIRIAQPYANDPRFSGVEIKGRVYSVKVFYFAPNVQNGAIVKAGDLIGHAQDLGIKYGSVVPNHLHVEVRKAGIVSDPSPYFGKDTSLIVV